MKNIVITQPIGFSDAQLVELRSLGNVTAYDTISKNTDEWLERVKDADIICSNNYGLDDGWRNLRNVYVTYPFVTTAFWDVDVMRQQNILASNSPGCNQIAVAEWIVAMLLNYSRQFPDYIKTTKIDGPIPPKTKSIYGKSATVIGKGRIGTRAGNALKALGMQVKYYERGDDVAEKVKDADYIVDCLSLNPTSQNFYNDDFFAEAKDGVVFMAISPNGTQDFGSIMAALESGKIGHFITDNATSLVFNVEDEVYKKLINHPKITITPHVAAYSDNTLETASRMCLENIKAFLTGRPVNLVYDPED
jgi:phosphoglycerate dehydrogenase-like enzyme